MSKTKIALIAFAGVLVVAVLLVALGIPANLALGLAQDRIQAETGYRLQVGSVGVSLWPFPAIVAKDVALSDPRDRSAQVPFRAESIRAELSLSSLLKLQPRVTEILVSDPVFRVPMVRERTRVADAGRPGGGGAAPDREAYPVERISIENGTLVLHDARTRIENRVEAINVDVFLPFNDGRLDVVASARWGNDIVRLGLESTAPVRHLEGQPIPVKFQLEAPAWLQAPMAANAEITATRQLVTINGVRGTIGMNRFNARASLDFSATKPLVKADLDFNRLDLIGAPGAGPVRNGGPAPSSVMQAWSDRPYNFDGLNFVDMDVRLSAGELNAPAFRFMPFYVEASLTGGILTATASRTGVNGGQLQGSAVVDATGQLPSHAVKLDLTGLDANQFLTGALDFQWLEGRMQAKLDLRASGASPRAAIATLAGSADLMLQDGAIRGVNVAQMIRSLTTSTLNGWQQAGTAKTDLTELRAAFQIANGQARTDNLSLMGPLVRMTGNGTADLVGKTLAFKVEPTLVMTLEGQGGAANPVGFGVPVMIQGPWDAPRFYPDIAGMLDNPDAAYARLRALGQGLFGPGQGLLAPGAPGQGSQVDTIIQQLRPLLDRSPQAAAPSGTPGTAPSSTPGTSQSGTPGTSQSGTPGSAPGEAQKDPQKDPQKEAQDDRRRASDDLVKSLNDLLGSPKRQDGSGQQSQGQQSPVGDLLRQFLGR